MSYILSSQLLHWIFDSSHPKSCGDAGLHQPHEAPLWTEASSHQDLVRWWKHVLANMLSCCRDGGHSPSIHHWFGHLHTPGGKKSDLSFTVAVFFSENIPLLLWIVCFWGVIGWVFWIFSTWQSIERVSTNNRIKSKYADVCSRDCGIRLCLLTPAYSSLLWLTSFQSKSVSLNFILVYYIFWGGDSAWSVLILSICLMC